MTENARTDAVDAIAEEVRAWVPGVALDGLPITGRILRLAHHLERGREDALARFGLTAGDFDLLATVRRRASGEPIKIRELQRALMLSSGGMTKRLDRLEVLGLIDRRPDPNDRRGTLIALTPAGRDVIGRAMPAVIAMENALVTAVASERDRSVAVRVLRALLVAQEAGPDRTP